MIRAALTIRVGLVISAAFFLLSASGAHAQTVAPSPTAEAEAEAERVIVTGSHIPSANEVSPNPVVTLDRELIDKSGERTTEELIRNLTVAGPNGVPSSNNGAGFTPGASSISLRGFDASSTLTLIDGRRVAPYPLGTDNGAITFVDLNSIPRAAIESIEVLKDSASSIYGADAVAGVVNIKLRHDYRGTEADVEYGNTLDKDSGEYSASLLFGTGDGNTSFSGVLNFYHRNSIADRDRGYSNKAGFLSSNSSPMNLQLSRDAVLAAGVSTAAIPDRDIFFGRAPKFTNGTAPATDYVYLPFRIADFNYNAFTIALPDSERYGGFLNASHKLFGDQMVLYADMLYQNVKTHYELAPTPTGDFQTPGNVTLAIPPHAPGPTLGGPSYAETGVPLGAFNPFNPFQQIISGTSHGRLAEFPKRVRNNETDAFLSTVGVKGDKLFDGNWGYDAAFRYSEVKNTSIDTQVSASRFNRILNAADPIFNPTSSQFIGTTVPYNPFNDFHVPLANNAVPTAFATIQPKEIDRSTLATLDLNIYSTSLFQLPAGGVGLAFGGQFRWETLRQNPDEELIIGDILGTGPGNFTAAGRRAYGVYAEASIPIFSSTFAAPGFHALDFTTAARFEDFRNNDTNVLVPKVGMRWQPFDDSFTLRATWGEGFHQPSLIELFGTPSQGRTPSALRGGGLIDRVTNTVIDEAPFIIRSNPNLQPEDSRSFSGGFVYTPKFVQGLTLTIDIFDIESKGRAAIPDLQDVLNRAALGQTLPLERINRDAGGKVISLEEAFQNEGSQKARGMDIGLQYHIGTSVGTFTWLTQASYLDSFQVAAVPGETEVELRSSGGGDEGFLKWRANSQVEWAWRGFDLAGTIHYLDGFHEILKTTNQTGIPYPNGIKEHYIKETWFFDVQATYNFSFAAPSESEPVAGLSKADTDATKTGLSTESAASQTANYGAPMWKHLLNGTSITLGCNNVFGHDPPDAATNVNYADFLYDSTGRFVYVSLKKKF